MDWYVDNEIGAPGDGTSPATAYDDIQDVLDDVAFANGDTIYIKANTTPYTGSRNMESYNGHNNIIIDRYPTDTGSSRPTLDREAINSWLMRIGSNDDFVVRNIHFKGSTSGIASTEMIAFSAGACTNVTFEYCIFETRNAPQVFELTSGAIDGFVVRYCHFISTDPDASKFIVDTNAAGHIGDFTFQYNLCENFQYMLYLNYDTAGKTVLIDHNTTVGCGGNVGYIGDLGIVVGPQADFVITNNLFDATGATSPTTKGFKYVAPSGSVIDDYNLFWQYDTPWPGIHTPGAHDLDQDPEWRDGAGTWSEAHIELAAFYAPDNEDYDLLLGDDSGDCLGAIFVAPYYPPVVPVTFEGLSLEFPVLNGGEAFYCSANELFTRIKMHLVDDNIYDTSGSAVGITNRQVTFNGSIGDTGATSLIAYRQYGGELKTIATIVPETDGSFRFSDKLPHGRASYYVKTSDDSYFSDNINVHSYNLHVWLCAYASELLLIKSETEQIRQNAKIEDGTDFSGDAITTPGYYLSKNFGQYVSTRKLESMTEDEYKQLLVDVLEAYNLGHVVESIDLICQVFTDQIPSLTWYKDIHGFLPADTTVRLRVLSPPSLDYEWDDTHIYLYDRIYRVPAGSGTVAPDSTTYVFVDGTTPVDIDNELSVLASVAMPFRYVMNWSELIDADRVRVDTDGIHTGVDGELFVTTERFPIAFDGASGDNAPFTEGIPGASLTLHTSNIDLGIAQRDVDKTDIFGNITASYTTNYEYRILGAIHSDSTEISGITDCTRIDGSGAVSRDPNVHHNCGEIRVRGSASLSDEAKADLFQTLKDIKPAQKFFYLYYEDVAGDYDYYGVI